MARWQWSCVTCSPPLPPLPPPSRLGEVRKKDALSPVPETTSFASSELGSTPSRQPPRPHLGAGPAHRSLENLTPPSLRRDERLTAEMGRGYRPLGLQQPRPALAFSHDAIPRPAILDSTRWVWSCLLGRPYVLCVMPSHHSPVTSPTGLPSNQYHWTWW